MTSSWQIICPFAAPFAQALPVAKFGAPRFADPALPVRTRLIPFMLTKLEQLLWYDRSITGIAMARPREFDEARVLDAAMETFWRKGYEGTSAQDLVDATGLGRGSLYAAYTNKQGIFEQALRRYHKRAQGHVDKLREPGSPLKCLRELMQGIVDADIGASGKRGCLATNSAIEVASRDPHLAALVRGNFDILMRGIEETIRRGQDAGEIRSTTDAETLALFVFNAVQGLRVLTSTASAKDRDKLTKIVDQTLIALT